MVVVRERRLVVGVGATVVVVVVVGALVLPLPDVSLRETSSSSTSIARDVLLAELAAGVRSSTATLRWNSGSRRLKGSCITLGRESNGEGT